MTRRVIVLGSTGSVGTSTLDILGHARAAGEEIEVTALTANHNVEVLAQQALKWRPKVAVVRREERHEELKALLAGSGIETAAGEAAVTEAAERPADWVMSSIVGVAGLRPTLAAARTGAVIALANKESIVCAGPLLLGVVKAAGGRLIPVDSGALRYLPVPWGAVGPKGVEADPYVIRRAVPHLDAAGDVRRHT